jgi:glutathione S-transferase
MRILYHLWLSPFCRKVRVALQEKKIAFEARVENVWERRPEFLALNPAGEVPVLVEPDGIAISGSGVICEFLEDVHPEPVLVGRTARERAEVRRLVQWFDEKFNREVTEHLLGEKIMKRFLKLGQPSS